MSKYLVRISALGLFLAAAGAGVASAETVTADSWNDAAQITYPGVSSVDSTNTLVPNSYQFWKDE